VLSSLASNFRAAWKTNAWQLVRYISIKRGQLCYNRRAEVNDANFRETEAAWFACATTGGCCNLPLYGLRQAFWRTRELAGMVPQARLPLVLRIHRGLIGTLRRLLTRSGATHSDGRLLLAIQMGIAVWKVSLPHSGIYNVEGYGLPLMLGVACFALFTVGAGMLSVDGATFERTGKAKAKA
jgi:hypothetical protein